MAEKPTERQVMELAVEKAKQSIDEDESGRHPKVFAVLLDRDGTLIDSAFRGENEPGNHAEFNLLEKKLGKRSVAHCTLFTTLEPCTTRGIGKTPCARRIIERQIGRVVIGTLDPNQEIRGK